MPIDPTTVYDKGVGPEDPLPKPAVAPKRSAQDAMNTIGPNSLETERYNPNVHTSRVNPDEYAPHMTAGVYDNQDINQQRGENQSAWDKWGNMLAGVVPKIGTSLAEGIGYMGSLVSEHGDDRDYSNAMTEWAKDATASIDAAFPMYRKNNDTFGLTDAAWWTQNIQGLAVSASSFALEGIGFAKLFGLAGKAAEAANAGRRTLGAVNKTAEVLSSGALAYTEGAMMGKDIFDKTYDYQLKKGMSAGLTFDEAHKRATHTAAQSAATTVQLNTMLNTGLNLEMMAGAFMHGNENRVRRFWEANSKQLADEGYEAFAKRVRGTSIADKAIAKQIFKSEGIGHLAVGAVSEGIEELTNNFAQRTGEELGRQWDDKKKSGRTKGMFDQLGELDHYFTRTMDKEGALSFALGAVGGVAQTTLIDNIPMHRTEKMDAQGNILYAAKPDAQGNKVPLTELVTARMKGKYHDRLYFNNVQKALVEDLSTFDDLKSKMAMARAAGEHDRANAIAADLFDAMKYNAVHMGMGGNYAQTFREIGDVDNKTDTRDIELKPQIEALHQQAQEATDPAEKTRLEAERDKLVEVYKKTPAETAAMKRGLSEGIEDNAYKAKALEAIEDLKALEDIHKKVQDKYGMEDNPAIQRVADIISNRKMSIYMRTKHLAKVQGDTALMEKDQDEELSKLATGADGIDTAVVKHNQDVQVAVEAKNRVADQYNLFTKAVEAIQANPNDTQAHAVIDNLIRKYSIVGMDGDNGADAVKQLVDTMERRYNAADADLKTAQDTLFSSTGYREWVEKNPGKSFEDFITKVGTQYGIDRKLASRKQFIKDQTAELAEANRKLAEIESEHGLKQLQKKSETLYKELQKKTQKEREAVILEMQKRVKEVEAFNAEQLKTKNRLQDKYKADLQDAQEEYHRIAKDLVEANDALVEYTTDNGVLTFTTQSAMDEWANKRTRKERLEAELEIVRKEVAVLETLYHTAEAEVAAAQQTASTPPAPAQVVPDNDTKPEDTTDAPEIAPAVVAPAPAPVVEAPAITPIATAAPAIAEAALERYVFEAKMLPITVQGILNAHEQAIKAGTEAFNMDLLRPQIKDGTIQVVDAARVLQMLKNYLSSIMDLKESVQEQEAVLETEAVALETLIQSAPEPTVEDTTVNPTVAEPLESDVVSKVRSTTENAVSDGPFHSGKKIVDNATALATLGMDYVIFENDITGEIRRLSDPNKLNPNLSKAIVDPTQLTPGTKLVLAVDMDYKGDMRNTDFLDNDEYGHVRRTADHIGNYLAADKRTVPADKLDTVPIKITTEDGELVGWVHQMPWIRETHTEGADYANTVHELVLPDGTVIDNMAIQVQRLRDIRTAVVMAHNNGGAPVTTVVESKSAGNLNYNRVPNLNTEKSKLVWDKSDKMLPDSNLQMAIPLVSSKMGADGKEVVDVQVVTGGTETGRVGYKQFAGELAMDPQALKRFNGVPVALLPGCNGAMFFAPLISDPLFDAKAKSNTAFNSIVRAMELYIGSVSEDQNAKAVFLAEVDRVREITGFDVSTREGLDDFINQYYTNTTNFSDAIIVSTDSLDNKGSRTQMQFKIKIEEAIGTQSRGSIKIGTTYSGKAPVEAKLVDGKLNPEFQQALQSGLSGRWRNYTIPKGNLRGINSEGKFTEAKFHANGRWVATTHDNYNEFMKATTRTIVNGTNKLGNQYVYATNPNVQMDIAKTATNPVVNTATSLADPVPEAPKAAEAPNELDPFLADLFNKPSVQSTPVTILNKVQQEETVHTRPVSVEALQELYNFTAENHRNGKNPEQVLAEMERLGIPYLVDGYNPFSKCL